MKKLGIVVVLFLFLVVGDNTKYVEAEDLNGLTIFSETAFFVEGRSFETTVWLLNPQDIVGFQMQITYDPEQYELIELVSDLSLTANTLEDGVIRLNYADTAEPLGEVAIFTLEFRVLQTFTLEDDKPLLSIDDSYLNQFVRLDPDTTLATVDEVTYAFGTLKRALLGDINNDGVVSIIDVNFIQMHLVGEYEFDARQSMVANIMDSADGVRLEDVLRMQLYIAGLVDSLVPEVE